MTQSEDFGSNIQDELAEFFLSESPLCGVHLWMAAGATWMRIGAGREPRNLHPKMPAEHVATWWAADMDTATRIASHSRDQLTAGKFQHREGWFEFAPGQAHRLIEIAAKTYQAPLVPHLIMQAAVIPTLSKLEAEFARRRDSGDLKSVNRDYRSERELKTKEGKGGDRFPSYAAYLQGLRKAAIKKEAERSGARLFLAAAGMV